MTSDFDTLTVGSCWTSYDLAEREAWEEYAADPTYLNGRAYMRLEFLARRRCERAVRHIRYQRSPRKLS